MVNEDYVPDAVEDAVIDVLRREGRANPYLIREETDDLSKQQIGTALQNLSAAGWVRKRTRGLYDYVDDPRVGGTADDEPELPDAVQRAHDRLDEWTPADANTRRGRTAAKEVVTWLSEQDGPRQRGDVLAWAKTREGYYSASTLWDKVAQPALKYLESEGVVERTPNVGYEIVD